MLTFLWTAALEEFLLAIVDGCECISALNASSENVSCKIQKFLNYSELDSIR